MHLKLINKLSIYFQCSSVGGKKTNNSGILKRMFKYFKTSNNHWSQISIYWQKKNLWCVPICKNVCFKKNTHYSRNTSNLSRSYEPITNWTLPPTEGTMITSPSRLGRAALQCVLEPVTTVPSTAASTVGLSGQLMIMKTKWSLEVRDWEQPGLEH